MATKKPTETKKVATPSYVTTLAWNDTQDIDKDGKEYYYKKGDTYPRKGYEPTPERIAYLLGSKNPANEPLIKEV